MLIVEPDDGVLSENLIDATRRIGVEWSASAALVLEELNR